jgi:hypothetical protein
MSSSEDRNATASYPPQLPYLVHVNGNGVVHGTSVGHVFEQVQKDWDATQRASSLIIAHLLTD